VRIFRVIFSAAVVVFTAGVGLGAPAASAVSGASGASGVPGASAVNYVALGDSYSSGVGAGDYLSASGSCERSADAYPEQWADANAPASFVSVACSAATTADVIDSQISALSARTTLVSITIGGNDAGFSSVMEKCVIFSTGSCLSAVSTAETFVADELPGRLDNTLQAIRAHAPWAKVIVLGYPDLYDLSRSGSCLGLSTAARTALDQGANDLDLALRTAALAYKDTFADVRDQFAGHEICDSGSWLNSVDIFAISSSYHPNAAGQELGYLPVFTAAAR
jgi:lysophospholipase L1-like esterase